jgi:tetratricopeptide (TPR) repeat protein
VQDRPRAAPAFIGRDGELTDLLAGLDDAVAGSGRLFLLAGDPGIGKSRLAYEVAARAAQRGFKVAWGRCWEAGGAPAYWPWVQSLRACVRGVGGEELRPQLGAGAPFITQIVAEVAGVLPDVRPAPSADAEGGRFRLFDAVATFLRNAGAEQPLMLALDDLHAADAPSILLLRFVARELGDARVLVLGAYRDFGLDRDHPLTLALAELSREPATRHVRLSGLTEADVARLIQETAGVIARESVVAAVRRCTEGNPLFVEEVVRLLAAEGRLERIGDPGGLRLAVPEGIREVIGRRVARLPEQCGRVLGLASMFGRDFSLYALEQLSGVSAGELLDILDDGIAAGMVAEVPGAPGRLRFTHALIRDSLYEGIPAGQRLRLHQRAGEALEAFYEQDLDPHLAELAHHFFEAAVGGGAGKAVGYAERAGHRAMALLAYEEAARLFKMALAALSLARPPGEEQARCRLLLALGDALTRMGERRAAREELMRAAGIARRCGMAEELGLAALAYAGRFTFERGASDRQVIPLLEEARAMLAKDAGPLRARVLAHLAVALRDQPERGPRDALSREAVALARTLDDPPTLAYTLSCRLNALMGPGDPQERLAIAEELRAVARAAQDKDGEESGEYHRAMVFLETGRIAEHRAALGAVERLAAELRQPASRFMATVFQARLALLEGRFADAEALVESALRLGGSSVPWDAVVFSRVQRFALRIEDRRLAELEPTMRRSVEEFPTRPLFRCLLARLFAELGDEDGARSVFEQLAAGRFAVIPVNNDLLLSLGHLAEVGWFLRDAERAAVLYDRLLPYSGLVVDTLESSTGAVDRYLGLAALTVGDLPAAERHLQDALQVNARIGARPWAARTQADLARLLLARDRPGDRERAAGLLAAALSMARRLGMTAFAERAGEDLAVGEEAFASDPRQAGLVRAKAPGADASWAVCRREGEYWSIAFAGEAFRLKDVKGLHYLAHLLRHPGREFHVLDLAAAGQGAGAGGARPSPARVDDLYRGRLSDAGPILDQPAKTAYRARLRELEAELDEATSWADPVRAEKARQEMQFLADQLAAAVGLGGRNRTPGSPAERARVNITKTVKTALSRIRAHSPALAGHLDATIHTGTFCCYTPDPRAPVTWHT